MKLSIQLDDIGVDGVVGGITTAASGAATPATLAEPAGAAINAGPSAAVANGLAGATGFATALPGDRRDGGSPSADLVAAITAAGGSFAAGNGTADATTSDPAGRSALDAGGAPV